MTVACAVVSEAISMARLEIDFEDTICKSWCHRGHVLIYFLSISGGRK